MRYLLDRFGIEYDIHREAAGMLVIARSAARSQQVRNRRAMTTLLARRQPDTQRCQRSGQRARR